MLVRLNRRHLLATSLLAAAASAVPARSRAQGATPAASPAATMTLAQQVAAWDPATLLETLRTTPFASPLLPAASGEAAAWAWDDSSDSDLATALGGVVVDSDTRGIGTYIVFANEDLAIETDERLLQHMPAEGFDLTPIRVGEIEGRTAAMPGDYVVTSARIATVLVAGMSEPGPYTRGTVPADKPEVTLSPTDVRRSVVHALALIDHLDTVTRNAG